MTLLEVERAKRVWKLLTGKYGVSSDTVNAFLVLCGIRKGCIIDNFDPQKREEFVRALRSILKNFKLDRVALHLWDKNEWVLYWCHPGDLASNKEWTEKDNGDAIGYDCPLLSTGTKNKAVLISLRLCTDTHPSCPDYLEHDDRRIAMCVCTVQDTLKTLYHFLEVEKKGNRLLRRIGVFDATIKAHSELATPGRPPVHHLCVPVKAKRALGVNRIV